MRCGGVVIGPGDIRFGDEDLVVLQRAAMDSRQHASRPAVLDISRAVAIGRRPIGELPNLFNYGLRSAFSGSNPVTTTSTE